MRGRLGYDDDGRRRRGLQAGERGGGVHRGAGGGLRGAEPAVTASSMNWRRTVMPGGVAKGAYFSKPYPLFLVSGEGCYVTTLDGQRLLDCANHHTAGILGHRHPAVMEAVRRAVGAGGRVGWTDDGGV